MKNRLVSSDDDSPNSAVSLTEAIKKIPPDMRQKLEIIAQSRGITFNELVNEILDESSQRLQEEIVKLKSQVEIKEGVVVCEEFGTRYVKWLPNGEKIASAIEAKFNVTREELEAVILDITLPDDAVNWFLVEIMLDN